MMIEITVKIKMVAIPRRHVGLSVIRTRMHQWGACRGSRSLEAKHKMASLGWYSFEW